MTTDTAHRQLNIRLKPEMYQALGVIAREERRSVPQVTQQLIEESLRTRLTPGRGADDDTPPDEIARLAAAGGAFSWLADEPDLYDDTFSSAASK